MPCVGSSAIRGNKVHSKGLISQEAFSSACAALPLVSIDFVVYAKTGRVLLGLRNNAPAQGFWFTPGGRIRKNESHQLAMQRILTDELGQSIDLLEKALLMGVWDHFYSDSAFSHRISTHYVNLPYLLAVEKEFLPSHEPQHSQWMWVNVEDALCRTEIHPYAMAYIKWIRSKLNSHG